MPKFTFAILSIIALSTTRLARACDLCGCYTPQLEALPQTADIAFAQPGGANSSTNHSWMTGLYGAVAEQFTHFGTVQVDGREIPNATGQHVDSSITQLVAGYSFNSRFALQLNVPFIHRSFERPEGFTIDRGVESSLGDISLLAKLVAFHQELSGNNGPGLDDSKSPSTQFHEPYFTFSALALAGVNFPPPTAAGSKRNSTKWQFPARQ
jgi:hypothetical protein